MSNAPPPMPHDTPSRRSTDEYYWPWVLCVLGLDYFSTLAYQPSITFIVTGRLGPLATAAVVLVTLFGALPVYCYLAGRSPGGQGSLGILEKLIRGWRGKTLVLILLGFAATDFTMLKSLSLADASIHTLNKHDGERREQVRHVVGRMKDACTQWFGQTYADYFDEQLIVTVLLGVIGFIFWFVLRRGFSRNVLYLAVPLVTTYLVLTGMLIGGGVCMMVDHPEIVADWFFQVQHGAALMPRLDRHTDGWGAVVLACLLALPNLALGLSGFEMSMILMPQVKGKPGEAPPATRIRNTRKVLVLAALIMSIFLLGSVFVTTLLIPPAAFAPEGDANNRALAYLAHGGTLTFGERVLPFCGPTFGLAYDIVTVLVLVLAGTSVMTALSVLLPQFLLRFGMEFRWASRWGVLLIAFAAINTLVTVWFKANVEDQRGAYATGVLVLIGSAAVVTALDKRLIFERRHGFLALVNLTYFSVIAVVLVTTMFAVALRSPSGLGIALCFVAAILAMSIVSRAIRADELRTIGYEFKDAQSKYLWDTLRLTDFPILVPVDLKRENHDDKERQIRTQHLISADAAIVFLEVYVDDPSDFLQSLQVEVVREKGRFIIRVMNGVSLAHAIAAIALEMSRSSIPPGLHFGWPEKDMLSASWSYLAFGQGNIPWKVRELIHRAEKDAAKRPRVIVG